MNSTWHPGPANKTLFPLSQRVWLSKIPAIGPYLVSFSSERNHIFSPKYDKRINTKMMLNEHRGNTGNRVSFGPVAMALIKKGASFAQCINKAVFSHLGHFAEACGSRTSWAQPNCLPASLVPQTPRMIQKRQLSTIEIKIRVRGSKLFLWIRFLWNQALIQVTTGRKRFVITTNTVDHFTCRQSRNDKETDNSKQNRLFKPTPK